MTGLFGDELVPEWLDAELWTDFIGSRKQSKKPMTEIAKKRMLMKLERWNAKGININECLERSIINGWQDIYEPESKPNSANSYIQSIFAGGYRLDVPAPGTAGPIRKH